MIKHCAHSKCHHLFRIQGKAGSRTVCCGLECNQQYKLEEARRRQRERQAAKPPPQCPDCEKRFQRQRNERYCKKCARKREKANKTAWKARRRQQGQKALEMATERVKRTIPVRGGAIDRLQRNLF